MESMKATEGNRLRQAKKKTCQYVLLTLLLVGGMAPCLPAQATRQQNQPAMFSQTIKHDEYHANVLNKIISVELHHASIEQGLRVIAKKAGLKLVFSKNIIPSQKSVSLQNKNITLEDVLWELLAGTDLRFGVSSHKHLVVMKSPKGDKQTEKQIQQLEAVSGTVTDASTGEALPGVNIKVKGTTTGTFTDNEGHYELDVASLQDTLVFSFVGYQTQQVQISGRTEINVKMQSQAISGQEMVVTGYQKTAKSEVTGAVSNISSKSLQHATQSANTVNMLAGKLPGLAVKQTSGKPGDYSLTQYNIRGYGANPLVVIDGVPGGDINRINPNDIASISVIKDATGAEYGVRAANGVILVTTKEPKPGQVNVNARSEFGWSTPLSQPNPMNAYQYTSVYDAASVNGGQPPTFGKEKVEKYKNGTLPRTDWVAATMRKYTPHYTESISASGGSKKVNYRLSLQYLKQPGRYKSGDMNNKRVNIRSWVEAQLTDNLKTTAILYGNQNQQNLAGKDYPRINSGIYKNLPTKPIYANNTPPYYQLTDNGDNTVAITNADIAGYTHNLRRELTAILKLDYQIPYVRGLEVKGFYSFKSNYSNNKVWHPDYILYTYDTSTKTYNEHLERSPTTLSRTFAQLTQTDVHLSLNFNRTFSGKHKINALFLFDQLTQKHSNFNGSRRFKLNLIDYLPAGENNNQNANTNIIVPYGDQGFVGNLKYTYQSKYIVTGKFRYDGSSKFSAARRWGFFPSISAGWNISSEDFIENNPNLNFIDNLKLRASYGEVGDDAAANYQFLTGYTYPGPTYVFDGTVEKGFSPLGLANKNISWYTSKILDIGLDADMWNGRLNFSFDLFDRKRTGLLATLSQSLPGSVGATLPQQNLNSDENRGGEFQISTSQNVGSAFYKITANVSYARQKNLHVERHKSGNSYSNWRNNNSHRWNDIYWGYKVIGRFKSKEEIQNFPVQDGRGNTTLLPGDFKYEDYNGDGVINDKDNQPLGLSNNFPELTYGLNISAAWKSLDFYASFAGGALSNISYLRSQYLFALPFSFGKDNGLAKFTDRWHHKNIYDTNSPWVPGRFPANHGVYNHNIPNYDPNTFWLQSTNYVRLKSLTIGYTITPKGGALQSIRIFANGYNLFTWTGLKDIDPERIQEYAYPIQKKYNVGVNINF